MAQQIQLEVTTPERRVLAESVDAVTVPGLSGEIGVLPGHTPLISQLRTGILSYAQGTTTRRLHVSGGFVEVTGERVSVLADTAERPEEINVALTRLAREKAEKTLNQASASEEETEAARTEIERSQIRLQLASEASPVTT